MLIHEFRFLHVNILIKVGLGRATFFLTRVGLGPTVFGTSQAWAG